MRRKGERGLQSPREAGVGLHLWRGSLPGPSQPLTPLESRLLPLVTILLQLMEAQDRKSEASGQACSAERREDLL